MRNLALAMLIIALPCVSNAQSRSGTWDVSVSAIFQESVSAAGSNASSVEVNSDTGFGINFAYNYNNKLALGMDLEYLQPRYSAVLINDGPEDDIVINHKFSQFNTRIKGTFNLLEGPFTPFLEGGLGWSYFDSNVADGPPVTGCWWHPYWGYRCDNFYSTFDDTLFSYGAGAGLRYEFVGGLFVKASYNYWEMDGMGSSEDSALEAARIEFGGRF